ncbi:MAG TPA: 1-hydroxy-2-methyl-2-butenyl 4-diphosphate reductase [Myxococcota bacterium]
MRGAAPGARVVRTGMGPRRSLRAAERLRGSPARTLAVAGVCGALDERLAPGDVLVASALHGPEGERVALECDSLLAALAARGIEARAAAIAGVPTLAAGKQRAALRAGGADAVDMESFWLAGAAAGRPFAVLRVVLDGPTRELWRPDLPLRLVAVLRRLRAAAAALAPWAAAVTNPNRAASDASEAAAWRQES